MRPFVPQDGVTPLMCAAASGSKEIAEALLEKDAEVDAVRVILALWIMYLHAEVLI